MENVMIVYNKMKYLADQRLSLKAKGLMAMMIAYINKNSTKEYFSLEMIRDNCCDGVTAFNNALTELKNLGYVSVTPSHRRFGETDWSFVLKE